MKEFSFSKLKDGKNSLFKVGDKVKCIKTNVKGYEGNTVNFGSIYTVHGINPDECEIYIKRHKWFLDFNRHPIDTFYDQDFESAEPDLFHNQLMNVNTKKVFMKKLFARILLFTVGLPVLVFALYYGLMQWVADHIES